MFKMFRPYVSEKLEKHPIVYSICCIAYITVARILLGIILLLFFGDSINQMLAGAYWLHPFFNVDFALRYLFSIPAIYLIGVAAKTNGFCFVFTLKGFGKGLLVLTPFLASFLIPDALYVVTELDNAPVYFFQNIPLAIFNELARGMFEEVLFRGVLMTAFLVSIGNCHFDSTLHKQEPPASERLVRSASVYGNCYINTWERNIKKRFIFILICGAAFGLIHMPSNIFLAIFMVSMGFLFCANYAYSKNLLSCILMHALSNMGGVYNHLVRAIKHGNVSL